MGRPRIKVMDDSEKKPEVKKVDRAPKIKASEKSKTEHVDSVQSSENVEDRHVAGAPRDDKSKKPQKPGKAKPRSKKYQEAVKDLDRSKTYPLAEAVDKAKKMSYSKFNGTLEAHINTSQTGIRGLVSLPYASGRKLRILAFGKGAENSGADIVGSDETIEKLSKGPSTGSGLDFDLVITTPEWMPKLAKIARILGPKGLMPNPKNGTITDDLKKAVESFQAGKTEFKTEPKAPVIHLTLGKLSQPNDELQTNIKTLVQTVGKTRIKKVTLAPTMGPGIKIDLSSLA